MTYLKADTTKPCAQRGHCVISTGAKMCQKSSLEDLCLKMWSHKNRAETKRPGKFPILWQLQNVLSLSIENVFAIFYVVM